MRGMADSTACPEVSFILTSNYYSPGRFFAATELKVMLAHVILNYDVKMANGQGRPANWVFETMAMPDIKAEVMFRKRREAQGDLN